MSDAQAEQPARRFIDPLEPRVLPNRGFWTLNSRPLGASVLRQRVHRIEEMDHALRHVGRIDGDLYMSQGIFARPLRRAVHLACATHAYVDLDTYRSPSLASLRPDQIAGLVVLHCQDTGMPPPSAILFSGRGLYLKWYWHHPIPRAAAGRALAVNRALVRLFAEFGADPCAVDLTRILRVVGSRNSKTGETVRVLWQFERDGAVVMYDFERFADEVLPYTLEQIRAFRLYARTRAPLHGAGIRILSQERVRRRAERWQVGQKAFSIENWCWGVLEDLRTLAAARFNGPVPFADQRQGKAGPDLFGHIGACQLALVMPRANLWAELQAWGRIILPASYVSGDYARHSSTLLARAKAAAAGQTADYQGKARSPIWTYGKQRLIEMLEITPEEMRGMTRLITNEEKRRRSRETLMAVRRAAGMQERAVYESAAAERAVLASSLRAAGMAWSDIARRMELPTADAARKLGKRAA